MASKKLPNQLVYSLQQSQKNADKTYWKRIGIAWPHTDGKGFNLQLDCIPLDGKLTLRTPLPK